MPKRAQDYESDGGFVEDAPKNKKPKNGGNQLKKSEGKTRVSTQMQKDEDGNEFWEVSMHRRAESQGITNSDIAVVADEAHWDINFQKRHDDEHTRVLREGRQDASWQEGRFIVCVLSAYDTPLITIQGITLSIDQFSAVMDVLPQIESTLKSKGIAIPRPKYDGGAADAGNDEPEEEDEEEAPDEEEDAKPSKLDKFRMRPNHEATSDEEGG
ncbi:Transcriptional Coactivator p15 (PC4) [Teratosphaeria destructans]|uniref:Transcriptional Coactivator p15 (PC4) n=1 Tax=Teratosphaeria destructans TaxID=418781 RepID=A0A9W7T234_9PEZI|nr:Transcriptional Coactivator p15 (PC4) [Teratosphaeria destructans]